MIRVLRIMEYTYDSPEDAEEDMGNWYIPANGTKSGLRKGLHIKSAVILNLNFEEEKLS
jgi:hypothetical protein